MFHPFDKTKFSRPNKRTRCGLPHLGKNQTAPEAWNRGPLPERQRLLLMKWEVQKKNTRQAENRQVHSRLHDRRYRKIPPDAQQLYVCCNSNRPTP